MKDTPFERRQHESTAKHQNNLKRFLRDIQNDHERSEREKQKAKDEVARLNKLTGNSVSPAQPAPALTAPTPRKPATGPLTAVDQKRQWIQLAEMGIQVPDTYRGELAQASNWSVVSKPKVEEASGEESLSKGVRKRKLEEGEELEQDVIQQSRKAWGQSIKSYPGQDSSDLDALLSGKLPSKKEQTEIKAEKQDPPAYDGGKNPLDTPNIADKAASPVVHEHMSVNERASAATASAPLVKQESADNDSQTTGDNATPRPVFKKRKNKATSTTQSDNLPP